MILQKPDRFNVVFSTRKGEGGEPLQPLFVCALDETAWLSMDEAVAHVLHHHLATFYQTERTETDPPKGTYTFVAQCGMSGVILGPPNHHDYQNKLRELHSKRFARMPFETYKSRVKIVRDEAVVKQWVDEQSWKTEYICLNVPEAARLPDMAAVEAHFREVHLPTIIRQVDTHTVPGQACQKLRGGLYRIYRDQMDQQRRFPMQVATSLSQQFASRGLQFFKVNKTVTHVWVARPTFLDLENEPVSENVRRIVQFVEAHPKCTRRQVLDALAPTATAAPSSPAPAAAEVASAEEDSAPADPATPAPTAAQARKPASVPDPVPTPEQTAIIGDLHWLVHQGHVIEFANGTLETAKKPAPRPPQAAPKKKKVKAEAAPTPAPDQKAAEESKPAEAADSATSEQPAREVKSEPATAPEEPSVTAPASEESGPGAGAANAAPNSDPPVKTPSQPVPASEEPRKDQQATPPEPAS
jgi:hypothetical protein